MRNTATTCTEPNTNFTVIPWKVWVHTSGQTASVYGAVPYHNEEQAKEWKMEQRGYTAQWEDGTVGLGHHGSCQTEDEVTEIASKFFPSFKGYSRR